MNGVDASDLPGYAFGTAQSAISPVSVEELRLLEQTVGWSEVDAVVLQRHADLISQQAESMVNRWRSLIGGQPHLSQWFAGPDGTTDEAYKARVKRRFVQWVVDVAVRPHDRDWLNYQEEIGLRHTPAKKNATDGGATPPVVPLRYVVGFVAVVLPVREFFADVIREETELQRLQDAWSRAVLLHVALWSRAYAQAGLW